MILDRFNQHALYRHLHPRLAVAFDALLSRQIIGASDGTYEIDGRNVFAIVQRYTTKPREQGRWEAHRRYADVQMMVSGVETMGWSTLDGLTVTVPYDADKDIMFLDGNGGMGGGGGAEAPSVVREEFPDTAYWNAEVVTGPDGKAQVTVKLPDTLITWQVDTRGVTEDTRVGEAEDQIITSQELLVRPVTPRFLVANDHVQLAAIVQNNSESAMQVEAALQADGFTLDDPAAQAQQISLPAQGCLRVEWWGTAQDTAKVDLVFSVQGADEAGNQYQDAARPAGSIARAALYRLADLPHLRNAGCRRRDNRNGQFAALI